MLVEQLERFLLGIARLLLVFFVIASTSNSRSNVCYCNSKVHSCPLKSQTATIDGISGCNKVPFPSDSDDLTFAWIGL